MSDGVENAASAAAPKSGADAPDVPLEKVKKPNRPDDETQKQKVDELQEIINKNKKRAEEIKQILDDRKKGRGGSPEQQALKGQLADLRTQFQDVLKQKMHLREQLEAATKTKEAIRASLRELKSSLKFTSIEEIDKAIVELETSLQHSTLTLNEEKKVLDDIRKLKASRTAVGQYSEKLELLSQDDSSLAETQSGIKALDEELAKIRKQENKARDELTAQRAKEQENAVDVPSLIEEREKCREASKSAYEKIKDLRAEHDALWQEYKAAEKAWKAYQNAERARRREEIAAERAQRDAERAARLAEMAPEPFDKEITFCEQLIGYLSKFTSSSDKHAEKDGDKEGSTAVMDGMKVFKKVVEEEDAWMAGTGSKRSKAKSKKASSGGDAVSNEKLIHSLDMLEAFSLLKISVPASSSDVPATLTVVTAKKEEYLAKRKQEKEKKDGEATNGGKEDASGSGDVATSTADGKKKGGQKAAASPAALKLDDTTSWPTVGAEAATADAVNEGEEDNEDVEEEDNEDVEEEEEENPAVAAKEDEEEDNEDVEEEEGEIVKDVASTNGAVAVQLNISSGREGVSVDISSAE